MSNPKPAVGILRINSENECWDGLHVVCDCGTPDHAIDIHVGVNHDRSDPQWPFTEAEFFVKMYTPWFGWGWGRFPKRISRALKLIFTGYIELEHIITMRGETAAVLGQALIDGVAKAEANAVQAKEKRDAKAAKQSGATS
jgi:hypothetical protein